MVRGGGVDGAVVEWVRWWWGGLDFGVVEYMFTKDTVTKKLLVLSTTLSFKIT